MLIGLILTTRKSNLNERILLLLNGIHADKTTKNNKIYNSP